MSDTPATRKWRELCERVDRELAELRHAFDFADPCERPEIAQAIRELGGDAPYYDRGERCRCATCAA